MDEEFKPLSVQHSRQLSPRLRTWACLIVNQTLVCYFLCAQWPVLRHGNSETQWALVDLSWVRQFQPAHLSAKIHISFSVMNKLWLYLQSDENLSSCWFYVNESKGQRSASSVVEDGVLMRCWIPSSGCVSDSMSHIVVPQPFCSHVLSLAHDHIMSGHPGITKTYSRILRYFFWPSQVGCGEILSLVPPNQVIPAALLKHIPVMVIVTVSRTNRWAQISVLILALICSTVWSVSLWRFSDLTDCQTLRATFPHSHTQTALLHHTDDGRGSNVLTKDTEGAVDQTTDLPVSSHLLYNIISRTAACASARVSFPSLNSRASCSLATDIRLMLGLKMQIFQPEAWG